MALRFTTRSARLAPLPLLLVLAACGGQLDSSAFVAADDAATEDGSVTNDSGAEDTATNPPPDAVVADTTPPKGGPGSPCSANSQCASGVCSGGICATTCTTSSDCISGWYCSASPGGRTCKCSASGPDCAGRDNNCDGVASSNAPCATTPDAGPPDAVGQSCTSCVQTECGSEAQTCYFDAANCRPVFNCLQACGSYTGPCATGCLAKYPAAKPLADCFAASCSGCT